MWRSPVQGDLIISKTADTSMPYRVRFHGGHISSSPSRGRRLVVRPLTWHRRINATSGIRTMNTPSFASTGSGSA